MLGQVLVNSLSVSAMYILVALGLTLIMGIMDIINFTHGAMIMLGAYGLYLFFEMLNINYVVAAVLAILLVGGLGVIIEKVFLHRVRRDHLLSILVTLGLATVFEGSIQLGFGIREKAVTSMTPGLVRFLGVTITLDRVVILVATTVLVGGLFFFMQRSKPGLAMRAVTQNTEAALMQGVNVDRITSLAMFIACAFAAVAGVLIAPATVLDPYMGLPYLLKAFIVIILGGLGSIPGSIAGGFLLGIVDSISGTYLDITIATMLGFVMMMLILVFKTSGLMGRKA